MTDHELRSQIDPLSPRPAPYHFPCRRRPYGRQPVVRRYSQRALQSRAARLACDDSTIRIAIVTSRARAIRSKLCTSCWPIGDSSRKPSSTRLCRYQSPFVGHPTRKVPGIEMNTGALGHGLSISVGLALAAKLDNAAYRVFTLLGDGELAEGSNWEAAMAAAHYKLDNLTAVLDHNTLADHGSDPRCVQQRTGRREISCVWLERANCRWS